MVSELFVMQLYLLSLAGVVQQSTTHCGLSYPSTSQLLDSSLYFG